MQQLIPPKSNSTMRVRTGVKSKSIPIQQPASSTSSASPTLSTPSPESNVERNVDLGIALYFQYKSKYEQDIEQKRKKRKGDISAPLCVNCRQPVGMHFQIQSVESSTLLPPISRALGYRRFRARCGAEFPCSQLDFTIANRTPFQVLIRELNSQVDAIKLDIIHLKNQLLFEAGEEDSIQEAFNKSVAVMNKLTEFSGRVIRENIKTNHNIERHRAQLEQSRELNAVRIPQFKKAMAKYSISHAPVDLHNAIRYYINDILPQVQIVRDLRWDEMFVMDSESGVVSLTQRQNRIADGFFFDPTNDKILIFKDLNS